VHCFCVYANVCVRLFVSTSSKIILYFVHIFCFLIYTFIDPYKSKVGEEFNYLHDIVLNFKKEWNKIGKEMKQSWVFFTFSTKLSKDQEQYNINYGEWKLNFIASHHITYYNCISHHINNIHSRLYICMYIFFGQSKETFTHVAAFSIFFHQNLTSPHIS